MFFGNLGIHLETVIYRANGGVNKKYEKKSVIKMIIL